MKKIEIYDPAMCCSTGVCGPSPDEQLTSFAALLKNFADQAEIHRYNLAQEPAAFAGNALVQQILADEGPDALPFVLIDGKLAMKGVYPSRQQLEQLLGAPVGESCCGEESTADCCSPPEQTVGDADAASCCDDEANEDCCSDSKQPAATAKAPSGCEGDSCC